MKDERKQCKKHHESTIGKIIYGFLLFLPLFAIGSACLISTFNMSAKEESEIHYKYETNEVNSINDLVVGNAYHANFEETIDSYINIENLDNTTILAFFNIEKLKINNTQSYSDEITQTIQEIDSYLLLTLWDNGGGMLKLIYSTTTENYLNSIDLDFSPMDTFQLIGDFIFIENTNTFTNDLVFSKCENIPIESVETHNLETQDVFYNAVDKVTTSPLFNWTTNTGIYTVLNNTCNSLGITTTFVPLLLAYWLIISVMYFLYDIVLIILNILHRKIHEIQESI